MCPAEWYSCSMPNHGRVFIGACHHVKTLATVILCVCGLLIVLEGLAEDQFCCHQDGGSRYNAMGPKVHHCCFLQPVP